jgi:hypothetical protein
VTRSITSKRGKSGVRTDGQSFGTPIAQDVWRDTRSEEFAVDRVVKTGTVASFSIRDVAYPDAMQVLGQVGPELTVVGEITYLSDGGDGQGCFAVVEVGGIHAPLIVPVSRLRLESRDAGEALAAKPAR